MFGFVSLPYFLQFQVILLVNLNLNNYISERRKCLRPVYQRSFCSWQRTGCLKLSQFLRATDSQSTPPTGPRTLALSLPLTESTVWSTCARTKFVAIMLTTCPMYRLQSKGVRAFISQVCTASWLTLHKIFYSSKEHKTATRTLQHTLFLAAVLASLNRRNSWSTVRLQPLLLFPTLLCPWWFQSKAIPTTSSLSFLRL